MFGSLDISTSALVAQRTRMDVIAGNLANASAVERSDGQPGPFMRQVTLFQSGDGDGGRGVHVAEVVEDQAPPRMQYEPWHPLADDRGYVAYPNVDTSIEMVNLIEAVRAYEANVTAMDATKTIMNNTLRLLT